MDESFNTEPSIQPERRVFMLVFGCIILSILLTGATVLVARLFPVT